MQLTRLSLGIQIRNISAAKYVEHKVRIDDLCEVCIMLML